MISPQELLNAAILIVDDQETNVQLLEQFLSGIGYTNIKSSMKPEEVGTLHRQNSFDLILLDLQMPEMDGFQVMSDLQCNDTDSYLPVIVLTAQPRSASAL